MQRLPLKAPRTAVTQLEVDLAMEFSLSHAVTLLRRTPAVLHTLLQDLPEPWINHNEGGSTWSPFDVVGHLIHGERTDWIPRARIILEHGEARPFDPFDRLAQFSESKGKTLAELLDTFTLLRQQSLATLQQWQLTEQHLDRRGTHPAFGAVTLRQLLATWVVHDLDHLGQIARVLAKQYSHAVGPWIEYLSILKERP